MKSQLHLHIIGAGGVASYLLPVLLRSFDVMKLVLQDADTLEQRNLDRQLFSHKQVGENKAKAMLKLHSELRPRGALWTAIARWFTDGNEVSSGTKLLICVADNHTARRAAMYAARQAQIPCVVAGNEYYDSQAIWVLPEHHNTANDPLIRYPHMATDTGMDPATCQGLALESTPQLAIANMRCASHIMDLIWMHKVAFTPATCKTLRDAGKLPIEIFTSVNNTTHHHESKI